MKHIIDKSFNFCYGHRVHNQRLNTNFTTQGDACLACRHLHGHEGLVKIFLEETFSPDADEISNVEKTGMVTDFKHLGFMKDFIDGTLDHKFIMDIQDPLFKSEFPLLCTDEMFVKMEQGHMLPNLTAIRNHCDLLIKDGTPENEAQALYEKYEGLVVVNFVPTSENLSGWLLRVAQMKIDGNLQGVRVKAVEYWETPKSHCRVEA